jgi:patatin-related protein
MMPSAEPIAQVLSRHLAQHGLASLINRRGGAAPGTIAFLTAQDLPFRIRRLRMLARRLTDDWASDEKIGDEHVSDAAREKARAAVYAALALYFKREGSECLGANFGAIAAGVFQDPTAVLASIAESRQLQQTDLQADMMLATALAEMPVPLRRRVLFAYLGFPYYDTVTLPLLRGEGLTEFDPVNVDRISPEDAPSIRKGGAPSCLRGIEFYNFGAFFSRAYRENDYLWGRLHGAERMIDLIASALPEGTALAAEDMTTLKRDAFLAILDEEEGRLTTDPTLVTGIRAEVLAAPLPATP